jgi:hypothetical protein
MILGWDQHFSSQEKAAGPSAPAAIWHCSTQVLQAVNFGPVTSLQLPLPASQEAYCRHLSPIRYSMVHICGASEPHARSRPWQVVNPQVDGAGVGETFPPGVRVQPPAKSAATSRRPHMQGIIAGCLMNITSAVIFAADPIYGFI